MIAHDDRERLHDYLDGRLSASERTRFERDLASHTELRREFDALSALRTELASFRGETAPVDLKDSILSALRASPTAPHAPRRSHPTAFLITSLLAAGLAIGVTVLYLASPRDRSPAHLGVESADGAAVRGQPNGESEKSDKELDKSADGLRARAPGSRSMDDDAGKDARKPGSAAGEKSNSGRYGSRGSAPPKPAERGSSPAGVEERDRSPTELEDEKSKSDDPPETTPESASATPGAVAPAQASPEVDASNVESKKDGEPGRVGDPREAATTATEGPGQVRVLRVRLPATANGRAAVEALMGRLAPEALSRGSGFSNAQSDPVRAGSDTAGASKSQERLPAGLGAVQATALEAALRAQREANPNAVIEHVADESWLSSFVTGAEAAGFEVAELVTHDPIPTAGARSISSGGPATGGGGGGGPGGAEAKERSGPTTPGAATGSKAKGPTTPGSVPKVGAAKPMNDLAKDLTPNDPPLPGLDPKTWHWVALATVESLEKSTRETPESTRSEVTGGLESTVGRDRFVIVIVRDGE